MMTMNNRRTFFFSLLLAGMSAGSFCVNANEAPTGDQYEKMGWTKLRPLESPEPVAEELGNQDPIPLMVVENLGVSLPSHLVAGEMRFANVAGTGYIEMWTVYENGDRYFSRTLGDYGPMAKMTASSDWRQVMLPFQGSKDRFPVKLEINAVLPGGGEIEFRDLALYQSVRASAGAWWTPQQAGMIGGAAGAATGLLGALCGILAGMGKARKFVLVTLVCIVLVGIASLITGAFAASRDQPYVVWYPLVLLGAIGGVVGGITFPLVRKAYMQRELRQISAAE